MKNPVRLLVLLVLTLVGALTLSSCSSSSVQAVSPQDWLAKSQQQGVVIVDVRTPGEYAQGHVDGAINIDVEGGAFDQQIAKLDKNATYVVYCHSGRRSGLATDAMAKAGFTNVVNLQGGIADLQSAGASIVSG
ncbi:MAG: rhodanese-like domain-containing protein [Actinobacteria bacterium]|nr:rhodanese-like domain-containing protein [Actinomycetota bacterium]